MSKPNFLIIGAPKAGTTSIANYLGEHPEIFMPCEKEPFYFISDTVRRINPKDPMLDSIMNKARLTSVEYYKLFENVNNEKLIGEATVHYLYHYEEVIPKVKSELGDIPIIIVLRNPSLRAFSNYKYQSRGQIVSFEKALKLEESRKDMGYNSFWYYKGTGNYFDPVNAYLQNFSNVYICFFEDLKNDSSKFMEDIFSFLKVNSKFSPNLSEKYNPTVVPRNSFIHKLFFIKHRLGIKFNLPNNIKTKLKSTTFRENTQKINVDTLEYLKTYFKPNIQKLEKLIEKDLSNWYE
jgi:hypothetical protein